METTYKVRKVGGALVVTLPQHIVRTLQLSDGDPVTIVATKQETIMIRKFEPRKNGTKK